MALAYYSAQQPVTPRAPAVRHVRPKIAICSFSSHGAERHDSVRPRAAERIYVLRNQAVIVQPTCIGGGYARRLMAAGGILISLYPRRKWSHDVFSSTELLSPLLHSCCGLLGNYITESPFFHSWIIIFAQ